MKKKLVSLLLIASMLVAGMPLFSMSIVAEESDAPAAAYDYNQLYVSTGLQSLFNAYDLKSGDPVTNLKDTAGHTYYPFSVEPAGGPTVNVAAVDGGLYIGKNAQLLAADILPESTSTETAFTYQVVFALKDFPLENTTPATESQLSWPGSYVARPVFAFGPMTLQTELISKEAAQGILNTAPSSQLSAHQFKGGVSKSFIQLYDTWHSDYDRIALMNPLMTYDYDVRSSLTISGSALKKNVTIVGGNPDGTDNVFTKYTGKITNIVRDNAPLNIGDVQSTTNRNYEGNETSISIGNDVPMVLYSVRAYNRSLSIEEIYQNHFADIASVLKLNLTHFDYLSEKGKLEVYYAFSTARIEDLDFLSAQALLDTTLEKMPELYRYDYDSLYTRDGMVANISFADHTPDEVFTETAFYDAFDNLTGQYINHEGVADGLPSWTYGKDCLVTGTNGTLSMNNAIKNLDDYTVQVTMAHNTDNDLDLIFTGKRPAVDSNPNSKNRVSPFYVGPLSFSYQFTANTVQKYGVKRGIIRAWAPDSHGEGTSYTKLLWYSDDTVNSGDISGYQGDILRSPLNVPFDISFTHKALTDKNGATMAIYRGPSAVKSGDVEYEAGIDYRNVLILAAGVNMNIYSIRLYDHVLTEAEFKQNHFADLASITKLSLTIFNRMSDTQKQAVYDFCADIQATKENDIETKQRVEQKIANIYLTSNRADMAADMLSFKGFQVSTTDDIAMRGLFAIDTSLLNAVVSSGSVKATVGVLVAPAAQGMTAESLTVSVAGGNVTSANAAATMTVAVNANEKTDAIVYTSASMIRFGGKVTPTNYEQEYLFRAFVVLTGEDGSSSIAYVETDTELTGSTVTAKELATYFYNLGYGIGAVKTIYDATH